MLKNSYKLTNILNNLGSIPGVLSVYPGSDKENFTLFKALADEHVAKLDIYRKPKLILFKKLLLYADVFAFFNRIFSGTAFSSGATRF